MKAGSLRQLMRLTLIIGAHLVIVSYLANR